MGRAELHRLLALDLDRIDGDNALGARHRRALDGVHADAAAAHDDDGVPGSDVAALGRRTPTGRHTTRHQAHGLEWQVGVDLDDL